MKIYVVVDGDRGLGTILIKAFYSKSQAENFCKSELGGDYVEEVELEAKTMNYYLDVKRAIDAIEHLLAKESFTTEAVRAEFETNKANLEKLLRFL